MEVKKSAKANLDNWRSTFFLIGVVVALAIFYAALSCGGEGSETNNVKRDFMQEITHELDMIPLLKETPKVIPPQPKTEKPKVEEIKIAEEQQSTADAEQMVNLTVPEVKPAIEEKNDPLSSVEMTKQQEDSVFRIVEQLPEYPGGVVEFMKWLTKTLQYPSSAQRMKVQGTCVVQFIVNTDGSISDIKVKKSLSKLCDAEALRALYKMPKWKPGKMGGKPVRTQFVIPIEFKLQ